MTINRELAFLQNLYTMAITRGKAAENPMKQVRFARENNGRMRILTPEEETELLAHCGPQLQPLVITALHTGFRASELFSLTSEDVDPRHQGITVQAAYVKNSESRSVPMNEVLTATLQTVRMSTSVMAQCFGPVRMSHTGSFRTAFTHAVR